MKLFFVQIHLWLFLFFFLFNFSLSCRLFSLIFFCYIVHFLASLLMFCLLCRSFTVIWLNDLDITSHFLKMNTGVKNNTMIISVFNYAMWMSQLEQSSFYFWNDLFIQLKTHFCFRQSPYEPVRDTGVNNCRAACCDDYPRVLDSSVEVLFEQAQVPARNMWV